MFLASKSPLFDAEPVPWGNFATEMAFFDAELLPVAPEAAEVLEGRRRWFCLWRDFC